MSEDKTEQTAVAEEPKEGSPQTPPADSGAAQDDGLDALLREFDERKAQQEPAAKPSTEPSDQPPIDVSALAALEKRLNDQESRERRRELERVFDSLATGTNGDEVDAEAYLNARALRDPRLNQAYQERESNPKRWEKVFGELRKDFEKRVGKRVDKQATESREAASAAIRSASTAAPQKELTDKDIVNMSGDEWREAQRKLGVTPV